MWRWMEYMKIYDFELKNHSNKYNKAADALSRKYMHTTELMMLEYDLLVRFQDLDL